MTVIGAKRRYYLASASKKQQRGVCISCETCCPQSSSCRRKIQRSVNANSLKNKPIHNSCKTLPHHHYACYRGQRSHVTLSDSNRQLRLCNVSAIYTNTPIKHIFWGQNALERRSINEIAGSPVHIAPKNKRTRVTTTFCPSHYDTAS